MHRALLATESPTLYFAPPPPIHSPDTNADNKISPSIFLIIIILAIIFFIAGLFHLLVRCLHRPPARESEEGDNATDLQGQLQQLFHLHDSGVDQSFIDTLPVFLYKAIIGLKSPFDCAVCLCEFEQDDKLRLLPRCSHAFHLECIDTWLLSHSTCPLCRGNLLPDFSPNNNLNLSPVVLVLESGSESSREIVIDREADVSNTTQLDVVGEEETGSSSSSTELSQRSSRTAERAETSPGDAEIKVVAVKLGKFRNVDGLSTAEGFSSNSSNVDARRCYSMGSFEYVLDNSSLLQVAIRPSAKKQMNRKTALHMKPGHRPAMSECGCLSVRGLDGFEEINLDNGNGGCAKIGTVKRESYSVSKIWLRGKKEKDSTGGSIRRSVSFKLPFMIEADASKCTTNTSRRITERCLNHGHLDDEGKTSNSMDLQTNPPPYERMSLHWLPYGRQQKEDHSTPMSHV